MVNYCSVNGCGRNSKTSKHLFYYGIPKDSPRLEQWLQAIGREDLLEKNLKKLSYRVCSRHFTPSSIKNKHLCADAVPTLCLPNNEWEEEEEESVHKDIICNSCKKPILGFRYKCITCPDYDLCSKCEMFEAHSDHYLLRIPKPTNYKAADDLIRKLQSFVNIEHVTVDSQDPDVSSDDDKPIKAYIKQYYDSGIDLSEDVKNQIRNEVTRVLSIDHSTKKLKRKKVSKKKEDSKKKKMNTEDKNCGTEDFESCVPEVAFADVNDLKGGQMGIKHEIPMTMPMSTSMETTPMSEVPVIVQPMTDLNLTDADFMLTSLSVLP